MRQTPLALHRHPLWCGSPCGVWHVPPLTGNKRLLVACPATSRGPRAQTSPWQVLTLGRPCRPRRCMAQDSGGGGHDCGMPG